MLRTFGTRTSWAFRSAARRDIAHSPLGSLALASTSATPGSRLHELLEATPSIPLDIHEEVRDALEAGDPVVALESAIITHGLPRPTNLQTAQSLERIVRSTGSIPATIAVLNGRLTVGLTASQLESLAHGSAAGDTKVSRRDIAPILGRGPAKGNGGTTISGTMVIADMVGIKVFATGGLGGVHRGGELTWDVSADLTELGRTPVALVTAGVKSILDIGKTLEYLLVSGNAHIDVLVDMANMTGLHSGQLFAVPIPEEHEDAGKRIQAMVDKAVEESEVNGVSRTGKDATPWLLNRVRELTGGESVKNNIALVENTALVGGQIAVELAKMSHKPIQAHVSVHSNQQHASMPTTTRANPRLVVLGASAVDITSRSKLSAAGSTCPGTVTLTSGGVGRNMAEAAQRHRSSSHTPSSTALITVLGDDLLAGTVRRELNDTGVTLKALSKRGTIEHMRTPVCSLYLDGEGSLVGGVADFDAVAAVGVEESSGRDFKAIQALQEHYAELGVEKPLVAIDANFSDDVICAVLQWCWKNQIHLWFEPTSISKCTSILTALFSLRLHPPSDTCPVVAYASPNVLELERMYDMAVRYRLRSSHNLVEASRAVVQTSPNSLEKIPDDENWRWLKGAGVVEKAVSLVGDMRLFTHLVIKCGERGVLLAMRMSSQDSQPWLDNMTSLRIALPIESNGDTVILERFLPHQISREELISTTGAGDSLVGTLLSEESAALTEPSGRSIFLDPLRLGRAMDEAQGAAVRALKSNRAVADL
ncbi:hypothetical protein FRB97_005677 [Tulasnella sp. 331]|nr:hypothetical protein FRB97_005677 [Tulasnella sp. 331]KAG8886272.1 hypothetical protein FRB98_001369 [Tulasnella sp. 332]